MRSCRGDFFYVSLMFASMGNYSNLVKTYPQIRENTSDGLKVNSQGCFAHTKWILGSFDVFLVHVPGKTSAPCPQLLQLVLAWIWSTPQWFDWSNKLTLLLYFIISLLSFLWQMGSKINQTSFVFISIKVTSVTPNELRWF